MSDPGWNPTRRDPRPSTPQRRHARRQAQFRRRRLGVLLVVLLVVLAVVAVVETQGGTESSGAEGSATTVVASGSAHKASPTTRHPTASTDPPASTTLPPVTVDPGILPQTDAFPTTTSPVFKANMAALWSGIVANRVGVAQTGFFPESAYLRLKTVGDPQSDFDDRLVAEFALDIEAAHALLGSNPGGAQFVGVDVDASYGHWIAPGVCSNDIGYFELPNSRLVYRLNGQLVSVGIASMISWRGEWYVVHLGAVVRSGSGGQVDDPEPGRGTPVYSSTC